VSGGFADGFEFRVTVFLVWCFCELLIRVLEIFGCSVLRGVLVCVERRRGVSCFGSSRHVPLL
jgi:hypothetical protein